MTIQQENNEPVVSVVLPAFNVSQFIHHSIKSVCEQTLENIEILIVDDGSSDGTREAIMELAKTDPRIKPLYHSENRGVSAARNTAIEAARGKWIALVDPDDWIAPNRLEILVHLAEKYEADAIGDDQHFIASEGDEPFGRLMSEDCEGVWQLTPADFIEHDQPEIIGYGVLKMVIRRSFILEKKLRYRTDCARGEDCLFYCECFANGAKIYLTAQPFYYYRVNREGSATNLTAGLPAILSVQQVHEEAKIIFDSLDDPDLKDALEERERVIAECVQYRNVVTPLKNRQFLKALSQALSKPAYIPPVLRRSFNAAWARLQS